MALLHLMNCITTLHLRHQCSCVSPVPRVLMVLRRCRSDQLPPSPCDSMLSLLLRLRKGDDSGMLTGAGAEGKENPRAGTWEKGRWWEDGMLVGRNEASM